jgi:ParB family chromosome partitioning protein
VEEIVRNLNNAETKETSTAEKHKFPKEYQNLKKQLDKIFSSKIDISMNSHGRGKIVIPFKSVSDLERIVKIIENQE